MHLDDYTQKVHAQLVAAAALGDDRTQQIANTLATTLDSAVRLAMLDVASDTATEVNHALADAGGGEAPATVTAHLEGNDIRINVTVSVPYTEPVEPRQDDGDTSARITLRLSEALKAEIEKAAAANDTSVNTWIVRALSNATRPGPGGGGFPFGDGGGPGNGNWPPFVNQMFGEWQRGSHGGGGRNRGHGGGNSSRVTGWVTG